MLFVFCFLFHHPIFVINIPVFQNYLLYKNTSSMRTETLCVFSPLLISLLPCKVLQTWKALSINLATNKEWTYSPAERWAAVHWSPSWDLHCHPAPPSPRHPATSVLPLPPDLLTPPTGPAVGRGTDYCLHLKSKVGELKVELFRLGTLIWPS